MTHLTGPPPPVRGASATRRVLLSTYGSRGDVEPWWPSRCELQALGAEVRMCAPPDHEFEGLLARSRCTAGALREAMAVVGAAAHPRGAPPARDRLHRGAVRNGGSDAAVGCDMIVATAMSQFVGPSVAETMGIPYRYALFCPDVLDGLDGRGFNELFGEPVNTHRAEIGLPPVADVGTVHVHPPDRCWLPTRSLAPWRGPAEVRTPCRPVRGSCLIERTTPGRAARVPGRRREAGVRRLRQHADRPEDERAGSHRGDPGAGPSGAGRPRLGRSGPDRRPGRLLRDR